MSIHYPTATKAARLDEPTEAILSARISQALEAEFGAESAGLIFGNPEHAARVRAIVEDRLFAVLRERSNERSFAWPTDPTAVIDRIHDALTGLGPLQPLLRDERNEGIEVNSTHTWVVRDGERHHLDQSLFASEAEVLELARNVVAKLGARIDEGSPVVNVRLPDGSRLSAYIPPVSPFPAIVIRMHRLKDVSLSLLELKALMSPEVADFLRACVRARLNVVICGRTGSGKTTLLDGLLAEHAAWDDSIRIVTIEEVPELSVARVLPTTLPLTARAPNFQGAGGISIRYLVREALRANPDIIVVGEGRGAEAYDLLQAMNTGHDGSMTTCHANSPRDAINRLANMAGESPEKIDHAELRELIGSAVDLIVQLGRPAGAGGRRVTHVYEVEGPATGDVQGHMLWEWRQGALRRGTRPRCLERFAEEGIDYHWPAGDDR